MPAREIEETRKPGYQVAGHQKSRISGDSESGYQENQVISELVN